MEITDNTRPLPTKEDLIEEITSRMPEWRNKGWDECGIVRNLFTESENIRRHFNEYDLSLVVKERFSAYAPTYIPPLDPAPFLRYSWDEIESVPVAGDLVGGLISNRSFSVLFGPQKTGKSFICLSLAGAMATGTPWMGREVKGGDVVYITTEGQETLKLRVRALEASYAGEDEEECIEALRNRIEFIVDRPLINVDGHVDKLIEHIERFMPDPALIIVDTLSKTLKGMEYGSSDMKEYGNGIRKLIHHFSAAVLVVHHSPKNGETPRGSTELSADADLMIRTEKGGPKDQPIITISCWDSRNEPFNDFAVTLRQVPAGTDEDEKPVTSCLVEPIDMADVSILMSVQLSVQRPISESKVLEYLMSVQECTSIPKPPLPGVAEVCKALDMNRSTVNFAVNSLVKKGKIRKEGTGKAGSRTILIPIKDRA